MNPFSILIPLLLSSLLGLIGYLKDMREEGSDGRKNILIGGTRTLFLLSLAGLVSGVVYQQGLLWLSLIISISSLSFVVISYTVTLTQHQNSSFSDELSAVMAHVLSLVWVLNILPQSIILAAFVGTIFILEQREVLLSLGKRVSSHEASEIVAFLAIALIILPFLPNHLFSITELGIHPEVFGITNGKVNELVNLGLLNPYKTWFIVVFVSGIDIFGFLLKKAFTNGATTSVLPALLGGFVSSTSTTVSLAVRSKKEKDTESLVASALLANVASFFQLFIILAPISLLLFRESFPFLFGMIASGIILAIYLLNLHEHKKVAPSTEKEADITEHSDAFNLGPALKFALLLSVVKIVAGISIVLFGSVGFIFTAIIASFTGVDAITITLAELINNSQVTLLLGIGVFILINAVNLFSKILYSRVSGSVHFAKLFAICISIMMFVGVALQGIFLLF